MKVPDYASVIALLNLYNSTNVFHILMYVYFLTFKLPSNSCRSYLQKAKSLPRQKLPKQISFIKLLLERFISL